MSLRQHARRLLVAILALALWPSSGALAAEPRWDLPPRLVDEPPGITQLRTKYGPMTEAQLVAAGFRIEPIYVTATQAGLPPTAGAMGYHALHGAMMGRQFPLGVMEPDRPPVVLLGPDKRVIGVEWEAADRGQPAPQLHGQTASLGPPHPGVDQPHYMLHAYFRPDGKVLFGDFDPTLATPGMPNTGAGGGQGRDLPRLALLVLVLASACPLLADALRRRRAARGA